MRVSARVTGGAGTSREHGFTLIELLVVLAVTAAAAVLAMPAARTAAVSQTLHGAAADVAAAARTTRAAAIRSGAVRSLTIDAGRRSYGADGGGGPRALPPSVHLSLAVPAAERTGDAGRIRFWPGGGSSGGRLVLSDGKAAATVEIDWLTGGARVVP
jgi:general secretion pathway protein H